MYIHDNYHYFASKLLFHTWLLVKVMPYKSVYPYNPKNILKSNVWKDRIIIDPVFHAQALILMLYAMCGSKKKS